MRLEEKLKRSAVKFGCNTNVLDFRWWRRSGSQVFAACEAVWVTKTGICDRPAKHLRDLQAQANWKILKLVVRQCLAVAKAYE